MYDDLALPLLASLCAVTKGRRKGGRRFENGGTSGGRRSSKGATLAGQQDEGRASRRSQLVLAGWLAASTEHDAGLAGFRPDSLTFLSVPALSPVHSRASSLASYRPVATRPSFSSPSLSRSAPDDRDLQDGLLRACVHLRRPHPRRRGPRDHCQLLFLLGPNSMLAAVLIMSSHGITGREARPADRGCQRRGRVDLALAPRQGS